jgi:polyadenylate-binding protein
MPAPSGVASLYVGELDPMVTEANLFELFNMVGPVTSIRVCRDVATRRSLGYAYVNYLNAADADKAIDALNYSELKGRPIRIMWSQRDPAARKSATSNIFIKNLDPSIDNKSLYDTFSAFGKILSCKVVLDSNSVSKGYGYVHFETDEAADAAIQHVNGMLLNDLQVYVGRLKGRKERQSKLEEQHAIFNNLYVKNLPDSVTSDEELRALFDAFGPMISVSLSKDEADKSRGFGFVCFEEHKDAAAAVEGMNDKEVDGKVLYAGRAQSKAEREELIRNKTEKFREEKLSLYQGINLYLKNLDDSVTDEMLVKEFSAFGPVTSCKVMRDDKTGSSRGFGFVCFSSPDDASKALSEYNGKMLAGKPIYVALAQNKMIRRQQLAAQMAQRAQMVMGPGMPGMPGMMAGGFPGQPMFFPPGAMGPGGMGPGARGSPAAFFQQQQQAMMAAAAAAAAGGPRPPRNFGPGGAMGPGGVVMPQGMPQGGFYPGGPGVMRPAGGRPGRPGQQMPPPMVGGPGNRGGRGGFKYTSNARNAPDNKPVLNAALLASMPADDQKRMLGEALFPLINAQEPNMAGKITGMLLEMDNSELLHLLESPETLTAKIADAQVILEEHRQKQAMETRIAALAPGVVPPPGYLESQ